ncbi:MAG: dihydrofolate reductase family protein [Balneolaceae bacterium]
MKKIFLHIMISLDGFIEGPDKELDWHFVDREFEEYSNNMLRSIDGILIGRKVYQLFVDYWPAAAENPSGAADPSDPSLHIEAAHLLNELPKYVVSTTMEKAEWNNSHIISGNIFEELTRLKKGEGNIALFGGASLVSSMMEMNLIDEYRLIVNPVLLGGGTPLFNGGYKRSALKFMDLIKFKSGAVAYTYKYDK